MFEELHGRRLMLTDVIYQKESKLTGWHDYINMVYRDLLTGEKHLYTIRDPKYVIYVVKEEYRTFQNARHYLEIEKCDPVEICYKDRFKAIAEIGGEQTKYIFRNAKTNNEKKQLFKYPYVLGADIPIETYYRVQWEKELHNDDRKIPTAIYLDIEVDQFGWDGGGIPRSGECPIDAISVVDPTSMTVYQFLLHTKDNPQIDDFINNRQDEVQQRFHEMFDDSYGVFDYRIYMFDDEVDLITSCFRLIHTLKRDFCLIWNGMGFDIPYMIERIYKLGLKAEDVICHSDFPTTTMYLFEDTTAYDFDKKRDYLDLSSYTHYLDQMIMYASLRKSQGALRRVNLNSVGQNELGDTKLDYTDVGNFIRFSREDYIRYVLYNVKDTLLQYGIDNKCHDSFSFYNSCYGSFCGYKDGLKQTVSLRAFFYYEFLNDGYILGHNVNFGGSSGKVETPNADDEMSGGDDGFDFGDDDESFEGAINGDPELNSETGLELFGKRSKYLYGACMDFDFSAGMIMARNPVMDWNNSSNSGKNAPMLMLRTQPRESVGCNG